MIEPIFQYDVKPYPMDGQSLLVDSETDGDKTYLPMETKRALQIAFACRLAEGAAKLTTAYEEIVTA